MGATPLRPLVLTVSVEDRERLRLIADRRRTTAEDLASWLLSRWLDGPGRRELVGLLLGDRGRRPRGELTGQLALDDS